MTLGLHLIVEQITGAKTRRWDSRQTSCGCRAANRIGRPDSGDATSVEDQVVPDGCADVSWMVWMTSRLIHCPGVNGSGDTGGCPMNPEGRSRAVFRVQSPFHLTTLRDQTRGSDDSVDHARNEQWSCDARDVLPIAWNGTSRLGNDPDARIFAPSNRIRNCDDSHVARDTTGRS